MKKNNIIVKNGNKYLRMGEHAIPFDDFDKNGVPIIKPKVTRTIGKDGKEHLKIKVPRLIIKHKINGERII